MLMEKITAGDEIAPGVRDALEDVAFQIAEIRAVTVRMAKTKRDSAAFRADQGHLQDLMDQVGSRAGRIEPEPLTADALLATANAATRVQRPGQPVRQHRTSRALHEQYRQSLERETAAARALSAARIEFADARKHREACEQAYNAHGASKLVR